MERSSVGGHVAEQLTVTMVISGESGWLTDVGRHDLVAADSDCTRPSSLVPALLVRMAQLRSKRVEMKISGRAWQRLLCGIVPIGGFRHGFSSRCPGPAKIEAAISRAASTPLRFWSPTLAESLQETLTVPLQECPTWQLQN
eukprot:Skav218261  [mRNA]  locus=scaffold2035:158088:159250:- [translate_table: standard]